MADKAAIPMITGFEDKDLTVLNEALRKLNDAVGASTTGLSTVPSGAILMWSGSIATIPSGYYLCDGNNGTPDLRNRFIVCADADDAGTAKTTLTGAATQSGGSISHDHSGSVPSGGAHEHHLSAENLTKPAAGGTAMTLGAMTIGSDTHSHSSITVTSKSAPQPYYALAYIMKS